ncbi:thiol reductant ABC exporter subunit CydC [Modicisalibacter tunisiensis]|uniref:thiol reductant ABC exporter subunit CydC n=1 Tax=Modicisalibacter tunisiensis TaxID=390637 RepID=UPI001CCB0E99|nr:thiol reductant ABC exporter subunit CydC [Modicisalibacter tunisiensis]MBZ9539370.1 thiol reductant ABC exporter subunit CydC [Modicisalibacter tunisiensis]
MSDLRWWLSIARPYLGYFALGILLSVVTVSANMALLAVSGWFLASMAAAGLAAADFNYFTPAALIRGLSIARTGGRYLERLVSHDATLRLLTGLRVWFYRQVEPLSPQQLQGLRSGDLLARVRSDIDTLDNVYLRLLTPAVVALICLGGAVLVLAAYSVPVALVNLALLVLAGVALPALAERLGREPGSRGVAIASELKAGVVDAVEGLGELSVFGDMPRRRAEIHALSRRWLAAQARLAHLSGLSGAGVLLLTNLAVLVTAWLMVPLVQGPGLAAVDFAPVVLLVMGCFEAIAQLPGAWQALGQLRAATRRLRAFETLAPNVTDPAEPAPPPEDDTLCFAGVGARHTADGPWALRDLDLTIAPGEHVALVGPSGAGKSTVTQLLLRLMPAERGEIRWGGRPVEAYRSEDLRARLAVVPQKIYLFHATVRDNLLLGNPEADEAAMVEAARLACLHEEILALPEGYDTIVGEEGLKLSGGQIRRLGIARALLRDAPVVIMDEPGEGLDTATAARLRANLAGYLAGRSLLLISHHPGWARLAERVLLLERGRPIASGDHASLMRDCATYRRLASPGLTSPAPLAETACDSLPQAGGECR